ncbi:MAG: ribose 5-phosphate isomerase B [Leptospiraceae bacterium]|nr:ribose 5-phosphate isomerase B [Leptospiraceae bacterium]
MFIRTKKIEKINRSINCEVVFLKIGLVSDHGGFELKEFIKESLSKEYEIIDCGVFDTKSVDYPIIISSACKKIISNEFPRLIALCGTGIGASISANRIKGIRAALCHDEFTAEMSKRHNNANVLVLGGRLLGKELTLRIIDKWIHTEFEGGRHETRVGLLDSI